MIDRYYGVTDVITKNKKQYSTQNVKLWYSSIISICCAKLKFKIVEKKFFSSKNILKHI